MRHLGKVTLGLLEKVYFSDERFAGAASSFACLEHRAGAWGCGTDFVTIKQPI